jgi:hypothetical protein
MNAGAKKGLIWGLVLTGVGVGAYFLIKKLRENAEVEDFDTSESEEQQAVKESGGGGGSSNKVMLDSDKWVQKGARGVEVKYVQGAINNLITSAKKVLKLNKAVAVTPIGSMGYLGGLGVLGNLNSTQKRRVEALANLTPLKRDGDFGSKTETAVQVVEGKKGTNYCLLQKRRTSFNKTYKLSAPYDTGICKDFMVTK